MAESVYIETSIISYLTSRRSRDVVHAANQSLTRDWWLNRRATFELFTSELVVDEAGDGHKQAARQRLAVIRGIPLLRTTAAAEQLGERLLKTGAVPKQASADALHIAIATVHGIGYLLTWNCRHIANAQMHMRIEAACATLGYEMPRLCTPAELMGA